ncbi:MAG: hypothetical protein A2Y15_06500 [Clostridiales bacterium GWF2_36_10]|nr:MAG: hypothetical protein A2Y15_06500 [Clostridiales bacterium GWF2_36_10]HAN20640.1 hypothetical protein [Clostridiales bacterium]
MKLTGKQIKRHKRFYSFFKWLLKGWIQKKFAYSFEKIALPESPYIILSNHNAELDPILLGICFPHTYFVASEHLFNKGIISWLLVRYLSPIPRMKSRADATTVLELRRRLMQKCNICIFPEGNRSLDGRTMRPHTSTGSLLKSCKVPVVTYKFEGSFLTNPRWSLSIRKGKMTGRVVNIYTPEYFFKMQPDEINELLFKDIYEDAYQTQDIKMIEYNGKNLAAGLESALYLCPNCKKIGRLKSDKDDFFCECGLHTVYNKYGYFTGGELSFRHYTEWYDWQKSELKKLSYDNMNIQFFVSDTGLNIFKIDETRKHIKLTYTEIKMNQQQFILSNNKGEQIIIDNKTITGMSIYSRNSIVFEVKQDYYEIKPDKKHIYGFNARKYLDLYEFYK